MSLFRQRLERAESTTMQDQSRKKRDLIAQWAFDTRPILGRLHLWLEDVEIEWLNGEPKAEFTADLSFVGGQIERQIAMTVAVTSLGTRLFGRFGEGAEKPKNELNQVKKDADAISAYAMSEALWYMSRLLPENHAIMVSLGEGLMPKAGETPEMGSNPQLGFGRVYARPAVAKRLDRRVARLINDKSYGWNRFYDEIKEAGITIWGAAIDTLENTSRFAQGAPTGCMSVLHLFDQPLQVTKPYEGYVGNMILPKTVVDRAAAESVLIDYRTPRAKVVAAIESTYPGIKRENIHVWTLRGKSRVARIGSLWAQWEALGVHLVDENWETPFGMTAFTESGTYAPTYMVGSWQDDAGETHLFLSDGYAASAEAVQAASLAPIRGLDASLAILTSKFQLPVEKEQLVMHLNPDAEDLAARLAEIVGEELSADEVSRYRDWILEARDADLPLGKAILEADDFFPEKRWEVLTAIGYICPDPYSGIDGVEEVEPGVYRASARLSSANGDKRITFRLRLMEEDMEESRLVFSPLLVRFFHGEDYLSRPVRTSDSGRIRNELQTLCVEALEFYGDNEIRVHFDRIPKEVISEQDQELLREVLIWYKNNHPLWFGWLDLV
jgi:hypothetical protein